MEAGKQLPDVPTYNAIINHFSGNGDIEGTLEWLSKMEANRPYGIDVKTYNSVMNAYVGSGDGDGAEEIFEKMEDASVKPNRGSYFEVMMAYFQDHDYKMV